MNDIKQVTDINTMGIYGQDFLKFIFNDHFSDFGMGRNCIDETVTGWLYIRYKEIYPVLKEQLLIYFPPETLAVIDLFRYFSPKNMIKDGIISDKIKFREWGVDAFTKLSDLFTTTEHILMSLDVVSSWNQFKIFMRKKSKYH